MSDKERISRIAAMLSSRKDAKDIVNGFKCGGKKFGPGGKFFRTSVPESDDSMLYQVPERTGYYDIEPPARWIPEPYYGDYEQPKYNAGALVNYPIPMGYPAPQPGYGVLAAEEQPEVSVPVIDPIKDAARRIMAVENSKKYGEGEWDKLSDKSQSILVDYSYNPGLAKFPSLMEGFHSGNMDLIRKNYKRYVNGKELGRNKILLEEIDTLDNEYPIFRAEGGRLYRDGGNPNEIRPGESIAEWKRRITKQNATPEISGEQIIPSVVAASPQTKKGRYLMEKAIRPGIGKISSSKAEQLIDDFGDAISGTSMIITDPDVAVSLAYAAENLPNPDAGIRETQYNNARQAYLDSKYPGNDIFSQLYRWWRRKAPHKPVIEGNSFSGIGADIVSLNNNVIRLTPESKQSNALVNEFVESKYPSVMTAAEYKSDPNRIVGDKYRFPVSNVNFFAGIEDGKFKIDKLENFKDETTIFPARNIKSDVPEIYGIRIDRVGEENYGGKVGGTGHGDKLVNFVSDRSMGGLGWDEVFRAYLRQNGIDEKKYEAALDDAISQYISEPNKLSDYSLRDKAQMDWNRNYAYPMQDIYAMDVFLSPSGYRLPIDPVGWEQAIQDFGNKETDELRKVRERNYPYVQYAKAATNFWDVISNNYPMSPFNRNPFEKKKKESKYGFVDKEGNLHPISEYNASVLDGKTIIGNPNGSIFIGRLQDISKPQLDSLNAYLKDNPSRILRTDLGSFNQYRLDNPSLETYLEQYYEHPKPNDPNVFVVGTTEPNTLWNERASGGKIHIKPEIFNGKVYYRDGGILEGDFDVDDISDEELYELDRLGYDVDIL